MFCLFVPWESESEVLRAHIAENVARCELRLPKQWTQEAKRRREAHVPDEDAFRTKPQKRLTPNSSAKTRCESTRRACAARSFWRKSKKYDFMALGTPSVSAGSTHAIENRCSDCEIRVAA